MPNYSTIIMADLLRKKLEKQAKESYWRIAALQSEFELTYSRFADRISKEKIKKITDFFSKKRAGQGVYGFTPQKLKTDYSSFRRVVINLTLKYWKNERKSLEKIYRDVIGLARRPTVRSRKKKIEALAKEDIDNFVEGIDSSLFFEYMRIVDQTEKVESLKKSLEEVALKSITVAIPRKASVVPAKIISSARESIFEDIEGPKNEVVSYTFYNPSPVAKYCVAMANKTVSVEFYKKNMLPAHPNCKSNWIANLSTFKDNPPIRTPKLSKAALDSYTNL